MHDLAGGNSALDAPRKAMNSAFVCLSWKPPDSLIAYLAGSELLRPVRGRPYNAREERGRSPTRHMKKR